MGSQDIPDHDCYEENKHRNSLFWITILFKPRETIRCLFQTETPKTTEDLKNSVSIMGAFIAFIFALLNHWIANIGPKLSAVETLLVGPIVYLLIKFTIWLSASLFWKSSQWFGGHGEKWNMQLVVITTTVIPNFVLGWLVWGLSIMFGKGFFVQWAENLTFIWVLIVTSLGISEATGITFWKGLICALLPPALITIATIVLVALIFSFIWVLLKLSLLFF